MKMVGKKRVQWLLVPFFVVLFSIGWLSFFAAAEEEEGIQLDPTDDASVYEADPDGNYNEDGGPDRDAMTVRRSEGDHVESYYKFDLSDLELDEAIRSATLNVYGRVTSGASEWVQVYSVDEDWTETEITWNNRPEVDDYLGESEIGTGNDYWAFDVTSYVQEQFESNNRVSLALKMERGSGHGSFFTRGRSYHSGPYLEINGPKEEEPIRYELDSDGRSALYPTDWLPGLKDEEGRFLHDFSYAGYERGELEVPAEVPGPVVDVTKAPFYADHTGQTDATAAIQAAIDEVGAEGGGVVYVPAGTYSISPQENNDYALRIADSGVVLRGAGANQTFLANTETEMRSKDIILVSGEGNGWQALDNSTSLLTSDVLEPTTEIPVHDVTPYEIGDWVVVSSVVTEEFIAEHDMVEWWDHLIGNEGPAFYRQVMDIDEQANTMTIDRPTRYALKTRDEARVYKVDTPLRDVGIEDVSIGNRQHPGDEWDDNDYNREGTAAYEVHDSKMIHMNQVVNSWVKGVHSYRPAENADDYHILSNGIVLIETSNVSVLDSKLNNPQYRGAGGNGYLFEITGNDNFIQNSVAENGRHNYSFKRMHTNGNVIHRSTSTDPSHVTDFHMQLSMSNLIDSMTLNNDTIEAAVRPYPSSSDRKHGMTTSQTVIWNTIGNGHFPRVNGYIIDSRQFGHGYVIGTQGDVTDVRSTPSIHSDRDTLPQDFVEGVGQGAILEPQSLYEDQLAKRMERESEPASIETIRSTMDQYIEMDELRAPLRHQLTNRVNQAEHHWQHGRVQQATNHLHDFLSHLHNQAMQRHISESAAEALDVEVNALIDIWSE